MRETRHTLRATIRRLHLVMLTSARSLQHMPNRHKKVFLETVADILESTVIGSRQGEMLLMDALLDPRVQRGTHCAQADGADGRWHFRPTADGQLELRMVGEDGELFPWRSLPLAHVQQMSIVVVVVAAISAKPTRRRQRKAKLKILPGEASPEPSDKPAPKLTIVR